MCKFNLNWLATHAQSHTARERGWLALTDGAPLALTDGAPLAIDLMRAAWRRCCARPQASAAATILQVTSNHRVLGQAKAHPLSWAMPLLGRSAVDFVHAHVLSR
jgi:hypothetical protein